MLCDVKQWVLVSECAKANISRERSPAKVHARVRIFPPNKEANVREVQGKARRRIQEASHVFSK